MVAIAPFGGIRYSAMNISRLICPPYDIVSAARKRDLLTHSKDNFISVELPMPFPSSPAQKIKNPPGSSQAPYLGAARVFRNMISRGILSRDPDSYYVYRQIFHIGSKKFRRDALMAAVRLENPRGGHIYPHEKILPKAIRDRELLLNAARASTSPVFFLDASEGFGAFMTKVRKNSRMVSRAVLDGVTHELSVVGPPPEFVAKYFRSKRLYIADGHHRYDVALRYSRRNRNPAAGYTLGFIAGAFERGVVVLPTHRIAPVPRDISSRLRSFDLISTAEFKRLARLAASGRSPQPLKIRFHRRTMHLALKNTHTIKGKASRPRSLLFLAPSIASATLLSGIAPDQMKYTSSEREAVSAADKENKIAVIFPPPPMKSIIDVSNHRAYMPQKSTYFYPKAYAGLVVYPFDKNNIAARPPRHSVNIRDKK
jgi:uncharacterized protein (DUF1015 family)